MQGSFDQSFSILTVYYFLTKSPSADVASFESVACRGVPITKLVFDQSKHVAHLRQHPEAYTAAVRDFLATIRSKSK